MATIDEQLAEAVKVLRGKLGERAAPDVALILGSGLGDLADEVGGDERLVVPYGDIPHFRTSAVHGHKNCLVYGELAGVRVVVQQGRFHFYEGIDMPALVFPLRVMRALGARALVVTNAAGGVNTGFRPGDLMLITDHINAFGANPLRGPNVASLGPRFNDMSFAYAPRLADVARAAAKRRGVRLQEGVYWGNPGPSYETPAEVRMVRTLGGDAVGMSTVPEVIAASHMGMHVLGVSCITNMAAGILKTKLDHSEVIDVAARVKADFQSLVKDVLPDVVAAAKALDAEAEADAAAGAAGAAK